MLARLAPPPAASRAEACAAVVGLLECPALAEIVDGQLAGGCPLCLAAPSRRAAAAVERQVALLLQCFDARSFARSAAGAALAATLARDLTAAETAAAARARVCGAASWRTADGCVVARLPCACDGGAADGVACWLYSSPAARRLARAAARRVAAAGGSLRFHPALPAAVARTRPRLRMYAVAVAPAEAAAAFWAAVADLTLAAA